MADVFRSPRDSSREYEILPDETGILDADFGPGERGLRITADGAYALSPADILADRLRRHPRHAGETASGLFRAASMGWALDEAALGRSDA